MNHYPMPTPIDDPRFTHGLLFDVARVLAEHGYPTVRDGGDLVALQGVLFTFLYAPRVVGDPTGLGYSRSDEPRTEVLPVPPGVAGYPHGRRMADCPGAPAGFQADCGAPGPHMPHERNAR